MPQSPFKLGFCVSGKGRLFRAAVSLQKKLGIRPLALLADGKSDPGLKHFCAKNGIRYVMVGSMSRQAMGEALDRCFKELQLDLVVLTFDRLIPDGVVRRYPGKMINVHLSLLPAFKGFGAIESALAAGVKYTGASIHEVGPNIDGGRIISQCVVSVGPKDNVRTLGEKIYRRLRPMFLQVIAWYAQGRVRRDSSGRIWVRKAGYFDSGSCPAIEMK